MWKFALGDYERAATEEDSSTVYSRRVSTERSHKSLIMFLRLLSFGSFKTQITIIIPSFKEGGCKRKTDQSMIITTALCATCSGSLGLIINSSLGAKANVHAFGLLNKRIHFWELLHNSLLLFLTHSTSQEQVIPKVSSKHHAEPPQRYWNL